MPPTKCAIRDCDTQPSFMRNRNHVFCNVHYRALTGNGTWHRLEQPQPPKIPRAEAIPRRRSQ